MKYLYVTGSILLVALLVTGCIFSSDSPKKSVVKPEIVSVNISDSDTLTTSDVMVNWVGNSVAENYRYGIDGFVTGWFDSTSVILSGLGEGEHVFTVQAKKDTLLSEIKMITFFVDTIEGAGIAFSPRDIRFMTFVTLSLVDVEGIMSVHLEMVCDDLSARMSYFTPNTQIGENGTIISFSDASDQTRMIIDAGFAGLPDGVSGSHDLGLVLVWPFQGTGVVTIDPEKSEFRDSNNNKVEISALDSLRIKW